MPSTKVQRSSHRRQVSNLIIKIKESIRQENETLSRAQCSALELVYQNLKITDEAFHEELDENVTEDELNEIYDSETNYLLSVQEIKAELNAKFCLPSVTPTNQSASRPINVQLEKLSLPTFTGDVLKFAQFWDSFKNRIHNNRSLSNIDKFDYLRMYVKDTALTCISGLEVSEAGYVEAVNTLRRRYGRPLQLVNAHLDALFSLKELSPDCTIPQLRKLCDNITSHIRSLKCLGVNLAHNSQTLGPIMLSRIPSHIRISWHQHKRMSQRTDSLSTSDSNLDDLDSIDIEELLEFLALQVEDREMSVKADSFKLSNHNCDSQSVVHKPKRNPSSVSALVSSTTKFKRTCFICQSSNHLFIKDCPKFISANQSERYNLIRSMKLCFSCFSPRHSVDKCDSKYCCRHCKSKFHNSFLCAHTNDQILETNDQPSLSNRNANSPNPVSTSNLFSHHLNAKKAIILQTLIVWAHGPNIKQKIRVLLDNGSSQSFILFEAAQKLHLPIIGSQHLVIQSFYQNESSKELNICNLKLSSLRSDAAVQIRVNVTNKLCHPIGKSKIPLTSINKFRDLFFAEDYSTDEYAPIDCIIGSDYLDDVLTDKVVRVGRGFPVAVETKFGYTLRGPFNSGFENEPTTRNCHVNFSHSPLPDIQQFWDLESIGIKPEVEQEWVKPIITDGRFESPLPWKSETRPLCNVRQVRPVQERRDKRLPTPKLEAYGQYVGEIEQLGIIEKCLPIPPPNSWYMPHHGVWRKEKLRVVHDGSFGNPSINSLLQTGPNLLQQIPICLTMFRMKAIPISADIEKAFLQVSIKPSDRDFLRFIWLNHHYRFNRLSFGLSSAPAILNSCILTLCDKFQSIYPETVHVLRQSLYCDDLVTSVNSETELCDLKSQCLNIFSDVQMNLRKWSSQPSQVLGIPYQVDSDSFVISLIPIRFKNTSNLSRRYLLSCIAKIYDPLGLITPVTVRYKLLIQLSWLIDIGWDDPLPEAIATSVRKLSEQLSQIDAIPISRLLPSQPVMMCGFSDASQNAFACCVYLVNKQEAKLVYSKNRVSPSKPKLTIPRKELMGAILLVRSVNFLKKHIEEWSKLPVYAFTDSACVLSWIHKDPNLLKVFVQNRVKEIQKSGDLHWQYVPSKENPADVSTRGCSARQLIHNPIWFDGPKWLPFLSEWPSSIINPLNSKEIMSEIKDKTIVLSTLVHVNDLDELISQYSSQTKLISVTSWIYRFYNNLRSKSLGLEPARGLLSFEEKEFSLFQLIKLVQIKSFIHEYETLKLGGRLDKNSKLLPLRPKFDTTTGLLMTSPRTGQAGRILLPPKHPLVTLIIMDFHSRFYHCGTERTLAAIQVKYWIIQGRRAIRNVLHRCVSCQKQQNELFHTTESKLARFRSNFSQPFENTGLDHFGPLLSSNHKKMYILLFTCSCVRAVHLELVQNLSTEETLLAIRRFTSRRGMPSCFYSDNAKCFKAVQSMVSAKWKFIPERSPFWGGWWERLIRTIKSSMIKTLGNTSLNDSELRTIITELEFVMNSRPLTYVSEDPNSESPLTPLSFLIKRGPDVELWASSSVQLCKRLRYQRVISNHLRQRWQREYLINLSSWKSKTDNHVKSPKVGQLVLVRETTKRHKWPMGIITKLYPGNDGIIRAVELKLNNRLTRRATKLLVPLEIDGHTPDNLNPLDPADPSLESQPKPVSISPVRTKLGRIIKIPSKFKE